MENRSVDESDNMIKIHENIGEVILDKCVIHFDVDNTAYAYLKRGITIESFLNFAKQVAQMMLNCIEQGVYLETDLKKIRMEGDIAIFSVHFGESNIDYYSTAEYLKNLAGMATFVGSDFLMYVYDYMSFIDNNQDTSIEVLIDKIESLMGGEIGNTGIPKAIVNNRVQERSTAHTNNVRSYSGTLKSEEFQIDDSDTDKLYSDNLNSGYSRLGNLHSGNLHSGNLHSGNLHSGNLNAGNTYAEPDYDSYEEEYSFIGNGAETGVLDPSFWNKFNSNNSMDANSKTSRHSSAVLQSMNTGTRYQLDKEVSLVGKDQNSVDIFIAKDTVSRLHAQIDNKAGRFFVKDVGSTNGTFVNGKRIPRDSSIEIYNGDELKFSDEIMKFMTV